MKFQVKTLVAALVLVAAVPVQAAMTMPQTGDSSMTLTVFDRTASVSAIFDLGKNYSDFSIIGTAFPDSNVDAPGTNFSWDLTSGDYATAWSTFIALVDPANLQFAVTGADNLGAGAGSRGIISTLNQPAVTPLTTNPIIGQIGTWGTYLAESQSTAMLYENHTTVENGAAVGNSGILSNTLYYFQQDKNNGNGSVSVGTVGQSLAVFQVVSGSSAFGATTSEIFANNAAFKFTADGALTYTVTQVPEADTWALMLSGLGFMGFVARRRKQS